MKEALAATRARADLAEAELAVARGKLDIIQAEAAEAKAQVSKLPGAHRPYEAADRLVHAPEASRAHLSHPHLQTRLGYINDLREPEVNHRWRRLLLTKLQGCAVSEVKPGAPESRRTHIIVFVCCVLTMAGEFGPKVAGRAYQRMEDAATARSERELCRLEAAGSVQPVVSASAP